VTVVEQTTELATRTDKLATEVEEMKSTLTRVEVRLHQILTVYHKVLYNTCTMYQSTTVTVPQINLFMNYLCTPSQPCNYICIHVHVSYIDTAWLNCVKCIVCF